MKYFIVFVAFIFSFTCVTVHAQQNHFVYLQSDNKQSFYVKLNNKIFSSSSAGYLIIGKLPDGIYRLSIGFPKTEWPEQNLNISINNKDVGFLLKNFGEKGWGLFNMQTNEMLMGGNVAKLNDSIPQLKENDPFSTMLANVVNDSTILQKDIVKEEAKTKQQEIKEEPKEIVTNIVTDTLILAKEKAKEEEEPKKFEEIKRDQPKEITTIILDSNTTIVNSSFSVVKRTIRKKNKEGIELVYVDEFENMKDTIRIFIPVEKVTRKDTLQQPDVAVNNDTIVQKSISNPEKSKEQKRLHEVKQDEPQKKEPIFIEDKKEKVPVTKSAMINSDCKAFAGEEDFLKLRKKMAAENSDENMIKVAKKGFKLKCYSTELVKNLSTLFLKDEGKYLFFDIAYPYVSDSDNFPILESQLSDNYYITRFRAMIHK